jgi:quinol monooxygenase YgiN
MLDRRQIVIAGAAGALLPEFAMGATPQKYALFGKMVAAPGRRDDLIGYMSEGAAAMPGCLLYLLSTSETEPEAVFVYEVWESRQHHADSLKLPAVQAAIAKARPIIAGFGPERFEMTPVGGAGL